MNAKDILTHYQNFAVIGVTTNPDKFGYKIYQRLNEIEKTVYGVSPIYKEIDGKSTFPNLTAINIKECNQLNIKHIWLQPGTYNDDLISLINENNLNYYQNCVLIESQDL